VGSESIATLDKDEQKITIEGIIQILSYIGCDNGGNILFSNTEMSITKS
jgi:hypothetical protein